MQFFYVESFKCSIGGAREKAFLFGGDSMQEVGHRTATRAMQSVLKLAQINTIRHHTDVVLGGWQVKDCLTLCPIKTFDNNANERPRGKVFNGL